MNKHFLSERTRKLPGRAFARGMTLFRVLCCLVLLAAAVIGCGWDFTSDHSVRFSYRSARDFTRLPPLPVSVMKSDGNDQGQFERMSPSEAGYIEDARLDEQLGELHAAWMQAEMAEQGGDLRRPLQRAWLMA